MIAAGVLANFFQKKSADDGTRNGALGEARAVESRSAGNLRSKLISKPQFWQTGLPRNASERQISFKKKSADDGTRTRDVNLGKVAFYH